MDGDGFQFTSITEGVKFDLDKDGVAERVGWTRVGVDDAFVAVDVSGDGRINGVKELVGGIVGYNGFSYLAMLDGYRTQAAYRAGPLKDGTANGIIDIEDYAFKELSLWTDINHNGYCEESELRSLEYAGVVSLSSKYTPGPEVDKFGNTIVGYGVATRRVRNELKTVRVAGVRFAH